jgi:hypothetical protein
MIKTFLILTIFTNFLYSQQIILVLSDDFNTSKATLHCYDENKEVFKEIDVNLGRNGLAWGLGKVKLKQSSNDPLKREGDGKAPAGIFKLTNSFGYAKKQKTRLGYIAISKDLICVDDSNSKEYNKIIKMPKVKPNSFEWMRREDNQYELGVVVAHNTSQLKEAGSCIFLHVQKSKDTPTAGCTSMNLENMQKIISWLDEKKNPILIQIPLNSLEELRVLFPNLPI